MVDTQLLCTFAPAEKLDEIIEVIKDCYTLAFDNIYVLENVEDTTQLILTYNIVAGTLNPSKVPPTSTISVHRKKQSNTIYTINALNVLIASKNGGRIDKTFRVDWVELKNSVLVTAHGQLKVVHTKIKNIVTL